MSIIITKAAAVPANLFSYWKGKFVAEYSDLYGYNLTSRIYDDACDVGFWMVSPTGNMVLFVETTPTVEDNEIQAWNFVCVTKGFEYLKAVVFND